MKKIALNTIIALSMLAAPAFLAVANATTATAPAFLAAANATTAAANASESHSPNSRTVQMQKLIPADSIAGPSSLIPVPSQVNTTEGVFTFSDQTQFLILPSKTLNSEDAATLKAYAAKLPLNFKETKAKKDARVIFSIVPRATKKYDFKTDESYSMSITKKVITIAAPTTKGCFYALQSILLMTKMGEIDNLQCCTISDSPRFPYRGLHFDVSRHFRSKEFLLKQIDAMALFKLNKMHLHLTDGAGWRLQIDAYPRLTEYAAYRPQKTWYEWWMADRSYCESTYPGAYGGYYTKADIKEILAYAAERHIDVIPEIEMPGHSEEVIAAYPELGCECMKKGSSDFCPGKETTFTFLETVLDEVIELFPSEYIHIGGDEASKAHWANCADCQARMKAEGLEDVDQLQSYLISRIERFVNSRGRKIIGWDEILQGGLAPNATVMSWRGEDGGLKAAQSGHDVIMTPSGYCYFDYTQDAPFKEPVSIGGFLPLEKTYSYEPANPALSAEDFKNILGVQGNLWTEYVYEDSHAEYMYYPRALAIAEIGWSRSEQKDYNDFKIRALRALDVLNANGYNSFDLKNEYGERHESLERVDHAGIGASVIYNKPFHRQYPAAGESTLVDGVIGGWTYGDQRWQGFLSDMDITIDMKELKNIHYIGMTFMNLESAWVHSPVSVEFQISQDGENFETIGVMDGDIRLKSPELLFKNFFKVCNLETRYIRIKATRCDRPGAWLFVDEIIIN